MTGHGAYLDPFHQRFQTLVCVHEGLRGSPVGRYSCAEGRIRCKSSAISRVFFSADTMAWPEGMNYDKLEDVAEVHRGRPCPTMKTARHSGGTILYWIELLSDLLCAQEEDRTQNKSGSVPTMRLKCGLRKSRTLIFETHKSWLTRSGGADRLTNYRRSGPLQPGQPRAPGAKFYRSVSLLTVYEAGNGTIFQRL